MENRIPGHYYVEDFGAEGNGVTNDAAAIQAALDRCEAKGGGKVILSPGKTYVSGSLFLREKVELYLEKGSVLLASGRLEDYYRPNQENVDGDVNTFGMPVTMKPVYVFLYAKDADELSIAGEGKIDGNLWSFVKRIDQYYVTGDFYPRPTMIYVEHCNHISFRSITLQNAPFWSLHPAGCDDVLIQNIRIRNPRDVANSDGIDPDHCTNVRILGCHIVCADDCICLKNTSGNREYGDTENVVVSDCTLSSTSAALKIGTEGVCNFKNIRVTNCCISSSNRGISIQIRDAGNVENVIFSNISIETRRFSDWYWGCGEPIAITALNRDRTIPSGKINNIHFSNISCKGENGVFVSGNAQNRIQNISFDQIDITLCKTSKWNVGIYDLRPNPDTDSEFIRMKSPGMYLRYVDGGRISNCKITLPPENKEEFQGGILLEECSCI